MATEASATAPVWTPSTTIMDMPNEILRDIFLSIDGEFSRTLWSLALTCRHFRNIVEEHCEPEYNLRGKHVEDIYDLLEQLRNRPSLKGLIRVARMNYEHASYATRTEAEILPLLHSLGLDMLHDGTEYYDSDERPSNTAPALLAASLSEIESLDFRLSTIDSARFDNLSPLIALLLHCFNDYLPHDSLSSHDFKKLRNLTLSNTDDNKPPIYHEDVFQCICALPSLRKLEVFGIYFVGSRQTPLSSSLEYIDMEDHQRNFDRGLNKKLESFQDLKHLRLRITDSVLKEDDTDRPRYIENLYFLENSLETLELFTNEVYCSPHGVPRELPKLPPVPSLRSFGRLKVLTLTDMSLVGVGSCGPLHCVTLPAEVLEHLVWMLPSSLEVLTHLVWDGPIIHSGDVELQRYLSLWSNIWKGATMDKFPALKKVMVQKYGLSGLSGEREVIWERKE